jgi:hypothetical protein
MSLMFFNAKGTPIIIPEEKVAGALKHFEDLDTLQRGRKLFAALSDDLENDCYQL